MFYYDLIKTCYRLSVSAENICKFLLSHIGRLWMSLLLYRHARISRSFENCENVLKLHLKCTCTLVRLYWILNNNSQISVFCCSEWFSDFGVLLLRMVLRFRCSAVPNGYFKQVRLGHVLLRCCSCIMAVIARSSYVCSPMCFLVSWLVVLLFHV